MKTIAIIVAGGSGTRFGSTLPKQFVELAHRPIMLHSVQTMEAALSDEPHTLVVVLPAAQQALWRDIVSQYHVTTPHIVADGGDTRYASVKNGIAAAGEIAHGDIILVHDAVRPLASADLIRRVRDAVKASRHGVVPVVPLSDSVRRVTAGGSTVAVERKALRAVQTPQGFDAEQLRRAYFEQVPYNDTLTDDASVIEAAGGVIDTVEGETTNLKITHSIDLATATAVLSTQHDA